MSTLVDDRGRPVTREQVRAAVSLDEVAARGRDDIFLGFIRATGLDDRAVLFNPDAILQIEARGKGLQLYDEVLRDPKVFSSMQTRKLAVVGKEWRVLPASEEAADAAAAEAVRATLGRIPCFHIDLIQAMDAVAKGFAIQEVLWTLDGEQIGIRDLRHRDPRRFAFTVGGELRLLTANAPVEGEPVPERKFLHYVFDPRYENPYGEALLSRVYWWWWFKKHAVKFWVIFAEKFGMPTAVGKYPPGASDAQKDTLLAAITALQQEYGVTIPDTMKVELVEAQRTGTINTYQQLTDYCDQQIALAILGQTLTSQVGDVGSFAAAKVHSEVRQDYVESDAKTLEATVNSRLIQWYVDFNFPPSAAGYPQWVLMVTPERDLLALAQRDERLVRLGLKVSQRYFYTTYQIPEPATGEAIVTPLPEVSALPAVPSLGALGAAEATYAEADGDPAARRISDHAEAIATAARTRALPIYAALVGALTRELSAASSFQSAARQLPATLDDTDIAPLGTLLHEAMLTARLAARGTVIEQAAAAGAVAASMAETPPFELVNPLPPQQALRWFTSLQPLSPQAFSALSDGLKLTAFRLARVEGDSLVNAVKDALGRALRDGTTYQTFLQDVGAVFDSAGVTRINPYHLETVFRTNLKTAYETGRYEQFQEPDVAPFFPFFQYHAVQDARTRPTHAAMNDRIYPTNDPIWSVWYPPAGFNCRCTVTAISAVEVRQRRLVASPPPPAGVLPDPGFGGSPVAILRRRAA